MKRNEGKKRVLSLLLALCMVLSYVPATVLAVEDGSCDHHSHDENCGFMQQAEGRKCGVVCEICASEEAVEAVKAAVAALPAVDAAHAMSNEELGGKNNSIQSAYEAYDGLTDDQKAQLSTEYEKLIGLLRELSDPSRVAPAVESVDYAITTGSTSESETFHVYTNNGNAFTGDDNSVILWCSAIFVSAMCMLIFLLVPRKKGKYLR